MAPRKFTAADRANDVRVGERLAKVMAAYGLSQSAVARTLRVSRSTVSEWLSGKKHMDVNVARTIREQWHVSLDYLYCGDHSSLPIPLANAIIHGKPMHSLAPR